MIVYICDVCNKEVKSGEMIGKFSSMEWNLTGKKGASQMPSEYLLCQSCKERVKKHIVHLIELAKKENNG